MSQHTLIQYDLEELARPIMGLLDDFRDYFMGWVKVHQLLLEGKPVAPDRMAAHLGITEDEVAALVKGAELDQEGNVVGMGLSIVPTPHSYRIHGRQLYAWCAFDAIMFPILHKSTAVIESPDPISGEKIRLISTPEGVRDLDPVNAVVSWVPERADPENVRAMLCRFTHFFSSVETASQYVAKHPGLLIIPVDQAFQIGRLIWEREPYKSMIDGLF